MIQQTSSTKELPKPEYHIWFAAATKGEGPRKMLNYSGISQKDEDSKKKIKMFCSDTIEYLIQLLNDKHGAQSELHDINEQ